MCDMLPCLFDGRVTVKRQMEKKKREKKKGRACLGARQLPEAVEAGAEPGQPRPDDEHRDQEPAGVE